MDDGARDGGAGLTRGMCETVERRQPATTLHEHVSMCRRVACGPRSVSTVATHTGLSGPSTPRERGVRVRPRLRPCGGASRSLYSSSSNRPDRDRRAAAELALRDADAKIGARRGHISQLILVLFTSRTYTVCWRQAGLSVCRGPGFRRSDSLTLCPSVRGPRSRNYVCERGRVWDSKTC